MQRTEKSREPGTNGALSTILLSILVGLFAGSLGAAFHYSLENAFALHSAIAARFSDDPRIAVLVAASLGAVMAGAAFVLVRRFEPEASGRGIQKIKGAMAGLRPVRWLRV